MRTRSPLITVLAVISVVVVGASPAGADHGNHFTHWGHDYRPSITADCSTFGGTYCIHTRDAENFWQQNGFWPGFRGGNPFYGCGPFKGWISACGISSAQLAAIGGQGKQGVTFFLHTNNPSRHIDAARVFTCTDCNLGPSRVGDVTRHEYGHAIGLGHNFTHLPSIMDENASTSFANGHDRATVQGMYARHDNTLLSGWQLDGWDNERLKSTDGRFDAIQQNDGNFVVYGREGANFATNTNGWPNVAAVMQNDCNFVLYSNGRPIWATNTNGWGTNCRLVMQSDSNLVLYTGSGVPVWAIW